MIIDCFRCDVRGLACGNCAVTALVAEAQEKNIPYPAKPDLGPAELRALTMLANAGLIPPLRYAPRMARASLHEGDVPNELGESVEAARRRH